MGTSPDWPARDLLAHRVRATPGVTAVVDASDGGAWTYAELDGLVETTAETFRSALGGTAVEEEEESPGSRPYVAIDARTGPRFVVAAFGAWRAGVRVAPLAPDRPDGERRDRLDRLDPALVVDVTGPDSDAASPTRSRLALEDVPLDPDETVRGGRGGERQPAAPWSPDETALVLFTSGTIGAPKGVRLTHRNLVASAAGSAFRLGVTSADRWFDCLTPDHMGGLAPIVRSTLYGTSVVLQRGFDARETAEAMAAHRATGVSLVPTQLRRLLDADWTPPDSLRFALLGGAPAGSELLADCEAAGVPACPTYGTTETASQIATATPGEARSHPETVGSPLVVTDVTIIDREAGTPVDAGDPGELVVDGPIVTPGYLDDEATEAAFDEDGLHTGDLASRDEDGRLRIHGRVDDAILTGGETVHPWRVADALVSHRRVREAAVVGVTDPEWGERVEALVVTEPGATVDAEALREHCRRALAPYEVPKAIQPVDELPRTASGTVDRGAVRERLTE